MAVTRSGKDTAQSTQVSNANSEESQDVDARSSVKKAPKQKYVEMDKSHETALAFAWFLGTWKKKKEPNVANPNMTPKDYQDAMAEFKSLSGDTKNNYVAEAKKSYSIEDNGIPLRPGMDKSEFDEKLYDMSVSVYTNALRATNPGFAPLHVDVLLGAIEGYDSLDAKIKAPYDAEALRIYLIGEKDRSKLTPIECIISK